VRHLLLTLAIISAASPAGATEVEVTVLDAEAEAWNGQRVTVQGEIVGDYSVRDGEVWVQINDDDYASEPLIESGTLRGGNIGMGVRIPANIFPGSYGEPGGYHTRGPVVAITGTFRYADPETGGDTFVDAESVVVVEQPRPIEVPAAEPALLIVSIVMIAAGAALWARARWRLFNPKE
jgi:hypothetical protein